MYEVDLYARVRRAVLAEGKSRRAVAREFGLSRKTIRKMEEYSLPPGYRRQATQAGSVAGHYRRHSR
jgi:transposase